MPKLCTPCRTARDDPHYRFPIHLVHPEHGKRMVFDPYGLAICPSCKGVWRATRRNTVEFVAMR